MLAMPAHAEEKDPPSPPVMLYAPDIHVRIATAAVAPPQPQEIRLSSGAKTAIIITAIVVGALIIVGVIALHGPHGP